MDKDFIKGFGIGVGILSLGLLTNKPKRRSNPSKSSGSGASIITKLEKMFDKHDIKPFRPAWNHFMIWDTAYEKIEDEIPNSEKITLSENDSMVHFHINTHGE
jgi:hypothetical protein